MRKCINFSYLDSRYIRLHCQKRLIQHLLLRLCISENVNANIVFLRFAMRVVNEENINVDVDYKDKRKKRKQEFGEGSRQSMTDITNISPMEMTKGKINQTTPVSALNLAQQR